MAALLGHYSASVDNSGRRWLLPEVARSGVVLLVLACAGAGGLAWAGHYARPELLIGLGGVSAAAMLLATVRRRPRPAARTFAAVIGANLAPPDRVIGRCRMVLHLNDLHGQPRQFTHVDPHTPVELWPVEGTRVIVEVTKARRARVSVLWHLGVIHPDESGHDLRDLPRLELVDRVPLAHPSRAAARYLYPTERFRGEWRRHWFRWVRALVVGLAVALAVTTGYLAQVGQWTVDLSTIPQPELVGQLVWFTAVFWRGLSWLNNRLVLTNRRVLLIKGVLWRRVASVPLARAADISHSRSPLGALLGYGTFRFSHVPAFRPLWRVSDLPEPRDIYLQIVGETFEPGAGAGRAPAPVDAGIDDLLAAQFIG